MAFAHVVDEVAKNLVGVIKGLMFIVDRNEPVHAIAMLLEG